ncbi:hypothetical protein B0T19DRAFT_400289 [Cercophora scortea]|uniref:Uncharacterized protein n=1 Tax=Cercophora scortea TaxID=314031 RepID=A0AAE0ILX3_9PEZI|nr:hypothetical protein B0T19DRAFT_400289 [Cercophora scortea]
MTEPENFDDELFADLYNDDEPAAKAPAAAAPASEQYSAAQPSAPDNSDGNNNYNQEPAEDTGQYQQYNNGEDRNVNDDEVDDDDDDVDFNLGNGPSTTNQYSHDEAPARYDAPPPPPAATRGPNAKEDGWTQDIQVDRSKSKKKKKKPLQMPMQMR